MKRKLTHGFLALSLAGASALATCNLPAQAAQETGPKNVIYLIGDGMGYNFLDLHNAYHTNKVHYQVETGGDKKAKSATDINSPKPTQGFQSWNHLAMQTHWAQGNPYDSQLSWGNFEWNKISPTDSAAAGTAMATGTKTYNAGLGVDIYENPLENLSQRAKANKKSAGVVSSVQFSHATPAAFSAYNVSRNNYLEIANEQVWGDMDVVMGAGHPHFDKNAKPTDQASYKYIAEDDYNALAAGKTGFTLADSKEEFQALTSGDTPERVFGIAPVATTLQQSRTTDAPNDIVDLPTMTKGALNVLDNDEDGFFLMVEGGAIDWTGHANDTARSLEETEDFFESVEAVNTWVEENSSWEETLVIVTADHETGYLSGDPAGAFHPMKPQGLGKYPTLSWNSTNHTNQLVPFFYKGAGSQSISKRAVGRDIIRGSYIDNTTVADWLLEDAWKLKPEPVVLTDIDASPFYKEITWLANSGITTGWPDGTFRPTADIERGAVAAFFYRQAGSPDFEVPTTPTFKDVPTSHVFYQEIEWLAAQGITTGWPDGTFRPEASISREATAAFFYRAAGSPSYVAPRTSQFEDVKPGDPFYKEISWMQSRDIARGWADGTYRPTESISREAMAAFFYRYNDFVLNTF